MINFECTKVFEWFGYTGCSSVGASGVGDCVGWF